MSYPSYDSARRSTKSGRSGEGSGADPTLQPGQYPPGSDHGIFGGALPDGTGAPGTAGGGGDTSDPTVQHGQIEGSQFGTSVSTSEVTQTGAPGTQGIDPDLGGGSDSVTVTRPGSYLSGTYADSTVRDTIGGPEDWTQANDQGYGTGGPTLPALRGKQPTSDSGPFQPSSGGTVMRGGRAVR